MPTDSEIHYTRSADGTNLAYQVRGSGPLEIVLMLGGIPIDIAAEEPGLVRLHKRMTQILETPWHVSGEPGHGVSLDRYRKALVPG